MMYARNCGKCDFRRKIMVYSACRLGESIVFVAYVLGDNHEKNTPSRKHPNSSVAIVIVGTVQEKIKYCSDRKYLNGV